MAPARERLRPRNLRCNGLLEMQWPIRYVADDGERRILAFWIFCDLRNASFGRLCPKIAGSKGTAYRRLDKALSSIVAGLQGDGVRPD